MAGKLAEEFINLSIYDNLESMEVETWDGQEVDEHLSTNVDIKINEHMGALSKAMSSRFSRTSKNK